MTPTNEVPTTKPTVSFRVLQRTEQIGDGPLPLKRFITRKNSYQCCEVSRSAYGDQEQLMLSSSLSSKAWSTRRASGVNSGRKPIGLRAKNSVSCSTLNLKEGK